MSLGGGDKLASGARSAQFGTGGGLKSQVQWDLSMLTEKEFLDKYPGTTKARYRELLDDYNHGVGTA